MQTTILSECAAALRKVAMDLGSESAKARETLATLDRADRLDEAITELEDLSDELEDMEA